MLWYGSWQEIYTWVWLSMHIIPKNENRSKLYKNLICGKLSLNGDICLTQDAIGVSVWHSDDAWHWVEIPGMMYRCCSFLFPFSKLILRDNGRRTLSCLSWLKKDSFGDYTKLIRLSTIKIIILKYCDHLTVSVFLRRPVDFVLEWQCWDARQLTRQRSSWVVRRMEQIYWENQRGNQDLLLVKHNPWLVLQHSFSSPQETCLSFEFWDIFNHALESPFQLGSVERNSIPCISKRLG